MLDSRINFRGAFCKQVIAVCITLAKYRSSVRAQIFSLCAILKNSSRKSFAWFCRDQISIVTGSATKQREILRHIYSILHDDKFDCKRLQFAQNVKNTQNTLRIRKSRREKFLFRQIATSSFWRRFFLSSTYSKHYQFDNHFSISSSSLSSYAT